MTLTIDHLFAAMVGVPAIIALAKAGDPTTRAACIGALVCALGAIFGPVIAGQGVRIDVAAVAWVVCGVVAIIAGIRIANGALTSLMIAGGVAGALLELGVLARG